MNKKVIIYNNTCNLEKTYYSNKKVIIYGSTCKSGKKTYYITKKVIIYRNTCKSGKKYITSPRKSEDHRSFDNWSIDLASCKHHLFLTQQPQHTA
jgi:hypothetical protein